MPSDNCSLILLFPVNLGETLELGKNGKIQSLLIPFTKVNMRWMVYLAYQLKLGNF